MKKLVAVLVFVLFSGLALAQETLPPADPAATAETTATADTTPANPFAPYAAPEAVTVCHIDPTSGQPVLDESTGTPRCFVIPAAVSKAFTLWMLTQSAGLDADGNKVYKYASWWDMIVKHFIKTLVLPVLDQFPPDEVKTAKETAEAAAKAVDAAKESLLGVAPTATTQQ